MPTKDVVFEGLDGTFMGPEREVRAAALLIAGSGPTDRDGNGPGLRTDAYRYLADALEQLGIATLRYDKRGVGRSSTNGFGEADMTIRTFVADAGQALDELGRLCPGLPLTVIGHSEGSTIAILLGAERPFAKLISLCGAGFPLGTVLRRQIEAAAAPAEWKLVATALMDRLDRGETLGPVSPAHAMLFRESLQPFLASVWSLDPANQLAALAMRALVIGGGRDIQVGRADFDRLAAARPGLEAAWFEAMAHSLKDASGHELAALYGDPSLPLVEGLAERIAQFILS